MHGTIKLFTYNSDMRESGRHQTIISIIITFLAVSIFMVGIQYNRTLSTMKSILHKRVAYTQELNLSLSKLYTVMEDKWKKERINFTKLQTTLIANTISFTYNITGSKNFAQQVARYMVDISFKFSENTYAYVMDNQTGKAIAHPIEPDLSPPHYIVDKIRSACPEGLISYKWYKPGERNQQEKYAYIKCVKELNWAVGTSLYLEDIENSMSVVKQYISQAIDTLANPLEEYITLSAYPKVPHEYTNIPLDGTIVRKSGRYIAAVKSSLTGILYVYTISETTIIKKTLYSSLPFLLVMLFLVFVVYINLKNEREKEELVSEIWDKLTGIEGKRKLTKEELIQLIKSKMEEIETALTIKEFIGELTSLISASGTLAECLEYMFNYLQVPFKINGIYLYTERQTKHIPLSHIGNNEGISLSIPYIIGDKRYTITIYTKQALGPTEVDILGEILKAFFSKLEDIDKVITDPLTGAYSRRFLEDYTEDFLSKDTSSAILMLDLDHFKEVNDTLGHEEGDRVLKEVVNRIENTIRPSDIVIRLGGDEFIVFMKDISYSAMCYAADRIRNHIKKPPIVQSIPVSASIGAVWKPKGVSISIKDALGIADKAMYQAKEKRDAVVCKEVKF